VSSHEPGGALIYQGVACALLRMRASTWSQSFTHPKRVSGAWNFFSRVATRAIRAFPHFGRQFFWRAMSRKAH